MNINTKLDNITYDIKEAAIGLFSQKLKSVILYGSYARNENDSESDIDVLLLVDMPSAELSAYRGRIARLASKLSLESETCVTISIALQDLVTYAKYKDLLPFFSNVDSEGIVIYAA